jgi:hypothetical protein
MSQGWQFWRLTTDGDLAWLAVTRPSSRAVIDRKKVWTLDPRRRVFIANWFVTADHWIDIGSQWLHEFIDIDAAREIALQVPEPSDADLHRLTRPEAYFTVDQIDRHRVDTLLGMRVWKALTEQYRTSK